MNTISWRARYSRMKRVDVVEHFVVVERRGAPERAVAVLQRVLARRPGPLSVADFHLVV